MAVTMKEVRDLLDSDEPCYDDAALLGKKALPHLDTLVRDPDPMMAAKAAFLAGMIGSSRAAEIVMVAARANDPTVRVAAAAAACQLDAGPGAAILDALVNDPDPGVRKVAASRDAPVASAKKRGAEARARHATAPAQQPEPGGLGEGGGSLGGGEALDSSYVGGGEGGGDLGEGLEVSDIAGPSRMDEETSRHDDAFGLAPHGSGGGRY
jgi:hypothetical protein